MLLTTTILQATQYLSIKQISSFKELILVMK